VCVHRDVLQTLLFSATLHDPIIQQLSEQIQRFPTWVDLKGKVSNPHPLTQSSPNPHRIFIILA
jgi:superfamily II DNA/RNA helicase